MSKTRSRLEVKRLILEQLKTQGPLSTFKLQNTTSTNHSHAKRHIDEMMIQGLVIRNGNDNTITKSGRDVLRIMNDLKGRIGWS